VTVEPYNYASGTLLVASANINLCRYPTLQRYCYAIMAMTTCLHTAIKSIRQPQVDCPSLISSPGL